MGKGPYRWSFILAATGFSLVLLAGPVRADAIDGEWCRESSNFRIEGPSIRTPGGNEIKGEYSRHGFAYKVPANEPGAGSDITMVLRNEENLDLTRTSAGVAAAPERWIRCKPIS